MRIRLRLVLWALMVALTGTSAWSGPLAPEMRVVASRDRDFIERSGAQTIEELLDTGIVRYFYTGGQTLLVMVDGRPYCTSNCDLDTLPLSAVERIELLSGESLGMFGGIAVNGAINVVMRKDVDGFETRAVTRMPGKEGGNSWQGGVFWGGPVGEKGGHMDRSASMFSGVRKSRPAAGSSAAPPGRRAVRSTNPAMSVSAAIPSGSFSVTPTGNTRA